MRPAQRVAGFCVSVLSLLIAGRPVSVAAAGKKSSPVKQIQGEDRVLHALNRFTFGPRPGEVAQVRAMGVQRWFEQQLNPASIDDSALEQRLAMFPAMKMQQVELLQRYPSPQMLRQVMQGNVALPADPVEHAIYADQIAFYQAERAKREAAQKPANSAGTSVADSVDAKGRAAPAGDAADPATYADQLYSGLDAVRIVNLPPEQRMQRILAMTPDEAMAFRRSLSPGDLAAATEGLTPEQKETLAALQSSPRMIGGELLASRVMRDIYSERQLEAVMTDFWLNHFNVFIGKNQDEPYLLAAYERDVIRPHALGKFEDLLVSVAKSPAMLMYLDNWQSIGPDSQAAMRAAKAARNPQAKQAQKGLGLNENYARELMELHTLGVQCEVSQDHPVSALEKDCGRGYTQQDVTEVAKVLTGWMIDRPFRSGMYQFEERRHEPGSKTVLGEKIRENGQEEGMQVLHMLATSPATARFISTKLAVRFVSDTPPQAMVDRMAKAFVASGGDIKVVLRTMFDSPEFWSPQVYRAKVKTPLEFVVSAVRASDADVTNAVPLTGALARLGMPLYGMQTPNGYSWMAAPWVNAGDLVNRMNFALGLSGDRLPGTQTAWTRLLDQNGSGTYQDLISAEGGVGQAAMKEKKLELALLGQPVGERTRATVLEQAQGQAGQPQVKNSFAIRPGGDEPVAAVLNPAAMTQNAKPPQDRQAAAMAGLLLGSPEFQRR